MPTAKQLAALKKGREAMAKKRAAGKPISKRAKKPTKKKVVARAKTLPNKFLVKVTIRKNNSVGYLVSGLNFDTDINAAKKMSEETAVKESHRVFNILSKQRADFKQIEVVPAPK